MVLSCCPTVSPLQFTNSGNVSDLLIVAKCRWSLSFENYCHAFIFLSRPFCYFECLFCFCFGCYVAKRKQKKKKSFCSIAMHCLQILIKMQLPLKKSDCSVPKQSVKCFEIKRIRWLENITMLASSLVEQPPGQPIWGPVFAFLFVTLCVYIHSVRGYHYITHTVALQRGLLLWVHPCICKVGPTRMVLTDCTWCPRSWNVFLCV